MIDQSCQTYQKKTKKSQACSYSFVWCLWINFQFPIFIALSGALYLAMCHSFHFHSGQRHSFTADAQSQYNITDAHISSCITSSQKLGRNALHQVRSVWKSLGWVSFGSKKFSGQKRFSGQKSFFRVKSFFRSKIFLGQKSFWVKKVFRGDFFLLLWVKYTQIQNWRRKKLGSPLFNFWRRATRDADRSEIQKYHQRTKGRTDRYG